MRMISFNQYLQQTKLITEEAPPAASTRKELEGLKLFAATLKQSIPQEVDRLVASLRDKVLSPSSSKRTWGDAFKNWWHNLFTGRADKGNPYYWYNKVGELGRYESVTSEGMSLDEYRILNELATQLEAIGGAPVPRIATILNTWGTKAKAELSQHIDNTYSTVVNMLRTMPAEVAPEELPASIPATPAPESPSPTPPKEVPPAPEPMPEPKEATPPPEETPLAPEEAPPEEPEAAPPEGGFDVGGDAVEEPESNEEPKEELPGEAKEGDLSPEAIRDPSNRPKVINMLRNMRGRTKKTYDPQEMQVLRTVWEPWTQLHQEHQRELNSRGMNGQKIRSHNVNQLPYKIPWVLRKTDPRVEILKDYYPDLFRQWMAADSPNWRRFETDADTDETVQERINRFLQRSHSRTNKGLPDEPEVPPGLHDEPGEAKGGAHAEVLKARIRSLAAKDGDEENGLPDDVIDHLLDDVDRGNIQGVERWLDTLDIDLEEVATIDYYRHMLRNTSWERIDEQPVLPDLHDRFQKLLFKP